MEQENINKIKTLYREYGTPVSIVIAGIIIASAMSPSQGSRVSSGLFSNNSSGNDTGRSAIEEAVLPAKGVKLPVVWGDMGARLVEAGAIDSALFKKVYEARSTFPDEYERLLSGRTNGALTITEDNAGYLLN